MRKRHALGISLFWLGLVACENSAAKLPELYGQDTAVVDERGSEETRMIRRYLECKGRRCEDMYPDGAEAVAERSPEFKDVWDTLAQSESSLSPAEYAQRLQPKKRVRR